ncbi:AraC family transcriptional regulator, partial [Gluconacetobacter azotocaptans]
MVRATRSTWQFEKHGKNFIWSGQIQLLYPWKQHQPNTQRHCDHASLWLSETTIPVQDLAAMPDDPHFPPNLAVMHQSRRVEILAFPNVQLLDVTGPLQVFGSANVAIKHSGRSAPFYVPVMIAAHPVVTSSSGLGLVAHPLPPMTLPVDTLMVAGGIGVSEAAADPGLVEWLRDRAQAARRVASICTGAFLLAEAGLLDNRRAATHWSRCTELAQRFPAVSVESDPIFIRDGTIWTSAGVTAGIDLALAQVESDLEHNPINLVHIRRQQSRR